MGMMMIETSCVVLASFATSMLSCVLVLSGNRPSSVLKFESHCYAVT